MRRQPVDALLEARRVCKCYRRGTADRGAGLRRFPWPCRRGLHRADGPVGSGKTTLLALWGRWTADAGQVLFDGRD